MKFKKVLSFALNVAMIASMSVSGYASEAAPKNYFKDFNTMEKTNNLHKDMKSSLTSSIRFSQTNDIDLTTNVEDETVVPSLQGNLQEQDKTETETIDVNQTSFENSTSKEDIPNQRSGYQLNASSGTVSETLTSDDPWDYYVFTKNTNFKALVEFNTSEPGYTMTLGLVDYTTGQISLSSSIILSAGDRYIITFSPLADNQDYAWVIQSKNGSYGTSYSFTYDNNYTDAFYVAPNGDEYAIRNQKMYRNDSLVNTDYIHESDYSNQYGYQKRHIYMEDANVKAIHVGAVEWYESKKRIYHDNVIVLELEPGGTFTHNFYQTPPTINWGYNDASGRRTPRAIDSTDITSTSHHYLIYDIDAGKTIEFASGLSVAWTKNVGDKHDLSVA